MDRQVVLYGLDACYMEALILSKQPIKFCMDGQVILYGLDACYIILTIWIKFCNKLAYGQWSPQKKKVYSQ